MMKNDDGNDDAVAGGAVRQEFNLCFFFCQCRNSGPSAMRKFRHVDDDRPRARDGLRASSIGAAVNAGDETWKVMEDGWLK